MTFRGFDIPGNHPNILDINMKQFITPKIQLALELWSPEQIIQFTYHMFGTRAIATSSFQSQSLPLLHMISKVSPDLKVIFIDTGYHFSETLSFMDHVRELLHLNLEIIRPEISSQEFACTYGPLYKTNPDRCCVLRKVEPFHSLTASFDAWISGIRQDQTERREITNLIEYNEQFLKVNPLINWSQSQIDTYINENNLPRHPLESSGYQSIGCRPCTQPVQKIGEIRSGRWTGFAKTECGIHLVEMNNSEDKVIS